MAEHPLDCKYWIFDMDGTLTRAVHDFEAIRAEIGLAPGVMILEAMAQLPEAEARRMDRQLFDIELRLAHQGQAQPGAESLLQSLTARQKTLGILTRNSEKLVQITLQASGLSNYFRAENIVGREHCAPKPDAAGVDYLLQQWQAKRRDTVIIGDYLFDLQAGRAAGIHTIHFDVEGDNPWPELSDLHYSSLPTLASDLLRHHS